MMLSPARLISGLVEPYLHDLRRLAVLLVLGTASAVAGIGFLGIAAFSALSERYGETDAALVLGTAFVLLGLAALAFARPRRARPVEAIPMQTAAAFDAAQPAHDTSEIASLLAGVTASSLSKDPEFIALARSTAAGLSPLQLCVLAVAGGFAVGWKSKR